MMRRKELDDGLDQLKVMLVGMGERVEKVLGDAMRALVQMDTIMARRIIADDIKLNQIEESIDLLGARMIATQQPVAKDLRRILVAFKMAGDLERMGDLAVDIAKTVVRLDGRPHVKPFVDLPRMAEITQQMIRESIQSYVQENVNLACKMAQDDDQVDALFGQVIRDLYDVMMDNPRTITQAGLITFVGRYIERIADHATNIGESVIYLVTGTRKELNA
ncbi:phosphate signaling complex protein PhoU [Paenibacillus lycopersici]|uniref:Phosphate-specific transport system accessory protein PhoU n=1 Tax=Paenibacillus lycopersici TaxID=2704462 RepID=A0A6C0G8G8_9BACL|nr:phosphate signaling complex protein PhoU [Paenibacillus lycopersici]QHT64050.1 phosphate signaling complex protein PhoU [Paenibacillus lycopersici]